MRCSGGWGSVPGRTRQDQLDKKIRAVEAALDAGIPQLDPAIGAALTNGEEERAKELERGAELVIFLKRDHGALLQITGRPRKALQYEIGNAITATRMTRHQIPAALKPHSQRPSPLSSSSVRSSPGAKEAGPRCFNPSAHGQIMLPQKVGRQLKLVRITSAPAPDQPNCDGLVCAQKQRLERLVEYKIVSSKNSSGRL